MFAGQPFFMPRAFITLLLALCSLAAQAQMKVWEEPPPHRYGPFPEKPLPAPVADNTPAAGDLVPVHTIAEAGITDPLKLSKVDARINSAIAAGAFPGCRVLCAKDGKIFYDRAFGYFTYDKQQPVTAATVYDLASLSKVTATTLAIMRLYEQGRLDLDKTIGDYLPAARGTDKAPILVRNLLLHQAGLKAWIPFYKSLLDSNKRLLDTAFHTRPDKRYSLPVAKDIYLRNDYRDTIWQMIYTSPLEVPGKYVYSDLDYYFLAAIAEKISGKPMDQYVADQFYTPMGLKTIGYNPRQRLNPALIPPTEDDQTFRRQVVQGFVHDPGAALFGGVGGHAGVFSNAGDVAAIFQMLLNEGTYHGKRFYKPETVRKFIAYGSPVSRRGLGFDKPEGKSDDAGPTATRCSGFTFGHQGFTGTCAWADPQNGVVFVFLSNRVYPNAENSLITKLGVRTAAQDELYEALGIAEDYNRPAVKKFQVETGTYKPQ